MRRDLRRMIRDAVPTDGANLTGAELTEQLDQACGDADTKPPEGLTLKAMCK